MPPRRSWGRCTPPGRVEIVPCRSVAALLQAVWPVDTLILVGRAGWSIRRAARGVAPEVVVIPARSTPADAATAPAPASQPTGDHAAAMSTTDIPTQARPDTAAPAPRRAKPAPAAHSHGDTHRSSRCGALALSLGALGVVYGDIGTSPLYTVQLIFSGDHPMAPSPVRVYGALSLIFWALALIVTLKYVLLILRVDNHGEGGIMALVALIERVVKSRRKTGLVMVGVLGASLFYGDGMLTPAISVVSAVSGLKVASPALATQIVPFSLVILIGLFALQRFGTGAVGGLFGPVMVVWFVVIGALGLREVATHPGHPPGALANLRRRVPRRRPDARLPRARLGLPGGDGRRGDLCRHGPFRPQGDHARLAASCASRR